MFSGLHIYFIDKYYENLFLLHHLLPQSEIGSQFVSSVMFSKNVSMHTITNVAVLNFPFNHVHMAFLLIND